MHGNGLSSVPGKLTYSRKGQPGHGSCCLALNRPTLSQLKAHGRIWETAPFRFDILNISVGKLALYIVILYRVEVKRQLYFFFPGAEEKLVYCDLHKSTIEKRRKESHWDCVKWIRYYQLYPLTFYLTIRSHFLCISLHSLCQRELKN